MDREKGKGRGEWDREGREVCRVGGDGESEERGNEGRDGGGIEEDGGV